MKPGAAKLAQGAALFTTSMAGVATFYDTVAAAIAFTAVGAVGMIRGMAGINEAEAAKHREAMRPAPSTPDRGIEQRETWNPVWEAKRAVSPGHRLPRPVAEMANEAWDRTMSIEYRSPKGSQAAQEAERLRADLLDLADGWDGVPNIAREKTMPAYIEAVQNVCTQVAHLHARMVEVVVREKVSVAQAIAERNRPMDPALDLSPAVSIAPTAVPSVSDGERSDVWERAGESRSMFLHRARVLSTSRHPETAAVGRLAQRIEAVGGLGEADVHFLFSMVAAACPVENAWHAGKVAPDQCRRSMRVIEEQLRGVLRAPHPPLY